MSPEALKRCFVLCSTARNCNTARFAECLIVFSCSGRTLPLTEVPHSVFPMAVVRKFIEDKAKNASMTQSSRCITAKGTTAIDTDHPRDGGSSVQPFGSREISATPLVLHFDIFKASLARTSVTELREWIVKAASAQECPPEFNFPAVDQAVPKAWIEAYDVMDVLKGTTPCVLWREAVKEFSKRMGGSVPDAGEVLLRAMQHREAEGGVLLSLANPSDPVGIDMLHLDPAWLIELVRRLTDHNLVVNNREKQDSIKGQLREYARENIFHFASLWDTHRWVEDISFSKRETYCFEDSRGKVVMKRRYMFGGVRHISMDEHAKKLCTEILFAFASSLQLGPPRSHLEIAGCIHGSVSYP